MSLRALWKFIAVACCAALQVSVAHAQPVERNAAPAPSEAPQPSDEPSHAVVGSDPHAGVDGAPELGRKPLTTAQPSPAVAPGSIRVRVLDEQEQPVGGQVVELGTMASDGARTHVQAKTDTTGHCTFDKLAIGDRQAYRVNVVYDGAKYSAMPFRLAADSGYEVVIRRLSTTRDAKNIVLYVGATSVEVRDERLKLVQQARLYNVGAKTYVFPDGGLRVSLPAGVMAFTAEEGMGDQKLAVDGDQAFRLSGSITPGEVTLTWGFDAPIHGSTAELKFDLPWPTFAYRVLADSVPGLSIEVDDMPTAQLQVDEGRRYLLTEIVKRPGDKPLSSVRILVQGIPGPGPLRFIATGLAALVIAVGVWLARRPPRGRVLPAAEVFDAKQASLLRRVVDLDTEKVRGDIGEQFHAEQLAALEEELAALLYERAQAAKVASV